MFVDESLPLWVTFQYTGCVYWTVLETCRGM